MLSVTKLFEYVLYNITILLLDLVSAIMNVLRQVKFALRCAYMFFVNSFVSPVQRTESITQLLRQPKKIPYHLGIVINEEEISFSDIASLILWCVCIGVRHISVYDVRGYVKAHASLLYKETLARKGGYLYRNYHNSINIIFQLSDHNFADNRNECNGHKSTDYWVHLLSKEDGAEQVVQAVRNVCLDVQKQPSVLADFSVKDFDSYVKNIVPIPDPELILMFGPNFLMGFLPWHIRLSEIIFVSTHHYIELKEFICALTRYEHCEQRFGK